MLKVLWYRFGRFLVRLLARSIFEFSIEWKAPLPKGPAILAANHPSTIDPALLSTLAREPVSILIRETLFKVPLFGRSLRYCGHIPVVYGSGEQALEEARALLAEGKLVAIFPEGEISPEGGFHHAHSGLGRLALSSGVPVIPVGIHLDQKQLRHITTQVEGRPEVGTWYFHGPYAMTIGRALRFRGDSQDRALVRQVGDVVMHSIRQLSYESSLRVRKSRHMDWLDAAWWWARSPLRLIRSWSAYQGVRL